MLITSKIKKYIVLINCKFSIDLSGRGLYLNPLCSVMQSPRLISISSSTLGKILDKLEIAFEAKAFKAAFCSPLNSKSPHFSEVKAP